MQEIADVGSRERGIFTVRDLIRSYELRREIRTLECLVGSAADNKHVSLRCFLSLWLEHHPHLLLLFTVFLLILI